MRHIPDVHGTSVRGGQVHEALDKTGVLPADFLHALQNAELKVTETRGIGFRPSRGFELSDDRRINYIGAAVHA